MQLNFWCEALPYEEILKMEVLEMLKKHKVGIYLMVDKTKLDRLPEVLRIYEQEGIKIGLWPLLAREDGYWPSEQNVELVWSLLNEIFKHCRTNKVKINEVVLDLEAPMYQIHGLPDKINGEILTRGAERIKRNINKIRFEKARKQFQEIIDKIHQKRAKVLVTVTDFVLEDLELITKNAAQDFLEAPVFGLGWDEIILGCYNSVIQSSLKIFSYSDLTYALYCLAKKAKKKLGKNVSYSLGLIDSAGKSGVEPVSSFKTVDKLFPDIGAVLASGMDKITIYSLDGLLNFLQPEQELKKLLSQTPQTPQFSPGAPIYLATRKISQWLLHLYQSLK